MRSSITELSFHAIPLPPPSRGKSVTHVSGTFCYLCLEPHTNTYQRKTGLRALFKPRLWGLLWGCCFTMLRNTVPVLQRLFPDSLAFNARNHARSVDVAAPGCFAIKIMK